MSLYPVVSWGLVLVLGGVAVYVYKPDLIKKAVPAAQATAQSSTSTSTSKSNPKKPKTKKPKVVQDVLDEVANVVPSSSEETRAKKKRKITAPIGQTVTATTTQGEERELPRDVGKDIDDKAFAQQLAKAQAGTKLQPGSQPKAAATKRSNASLQPKKSEDVLSTAELSSTTGQDADDDLSSVESPQQKATSGKDISDMLEAPAAAPTTLRLTNVSDEPKKPKQPAKQFEQVQSKKKRNEQARREEQKRMREESDKIHEQKKQEQLRTARMAAGTSNQTKANTFTSTNNAWQNKPQSSGGSQTGAGSASLLDTFEPSSSKTSGPTSVQTASLSTALPSNNVTSLRSEVGDQVVGALAASGREQVDYTGRLSEEEQLRKLQDQEQDDAWESVTTKKSKKKPKTETDTSSEASFSVSQPVQPKVEQPAKKAPAAKTNGNTAVKDTGNRFNSIQPVNLGGLQDDEWAA